MEHSILTFLMHYLSDLNIRHTFTDGNQISFADFDLGLRNSILKDTSIEPCDIPGTIETDTLYLISDYYCCSYCFFQLPEESRFLFIGPYLLEDITSSDIQELMEKLTIPPELFPQLHDYYYSLPYLAEKQTFFLSLRNACRTLFSLDIPNICQLDLKKLQENTEYLKKHQFLTLDDPILSKQLLEQRYSEEDNLLDAIMQGKTDLALSFLTKTGTFRFSPRTGDELRDQKNLLLSFNTLLRRKTYESGVHPFYIDAVSSNYARLIEQLRCCNEAAEIIPYIIRSYCNLVEKRNMSTYSEPIRHILVTVDASLMADLSLKRFANELFLNTSYLSTLFKKEIGMTLTEYVTKRRITHAQKLLKSTTHSIQDIAIQVGIPDIHYFTRLFRRETNMSPRQWRINNI